MVLYSTSSGSRCSSARFYATAIVDALCFFSMRCCCCSDEAVMSARSKKRYLFLTTNHVLELFMPGALTNFSLRREGKWRKSYRVKPLELYRETEKVLAFPSRLKSNVWFVAWKIISFLDLYVCYLNASFLVRRFRGTQKQRTISGYYNEEIQIQSFQSTTPQRSKNNRFHKTQKQ